MPTGYTADVVDLDREPPTFPEFAMGCARGFGALIAMRDLPRSAPIVDEVPSAYHLTAGAEAEAHLAEIEARTDDEWREAHAAEARRRAEENLQSVRRAAKVGDRIDALLAEVRKWNPPTAEHRRLKEFMVEQLTETARYDAKPYLLPLVSPIDEWRSEVTTKARKDVEYHRKEYAADVERVASRNAWVRALRESLGQAVAS